MTIDTAALAANWQALNAAAGGRAGAVVKADAYGLGIQAVAPVLARAGARTFFVAVAEEGAALRAVLGDGPEIFVFSGHMAGDAPLLADAGLIPLLNDRAQWTRHRQALPGHPFGVQLDTGMNRLGMESAEWSQLRGDILAEAPRLLMSHLACADEPDHSMNARQLSEFLAMTEGAGAPRSLAATGGTLLDASFHFDLTRPGVGLYGGMPFADACPVAHLSLPVIQVRDLAPGESVGYGNAWIADAPARIATVAAGYADGLIRAMGGRAALYAGDIPCPLRGRVSMDLLTVDVTALKEVPGELALLNHRQGVDEVAAAAGTIGYEILTSLGARYRRGEVSA